MAKKFIPDSDHDFAKMARNFAAPIDRDPSRYGLTRDDADFVNRVVEEFRAKFSAALHKFSRSQQTIMRKEEARLAAERVIRKYGNRIRIDESVNRVDKMLIGLIERPQTLRKGKCPKTPPYLRYTGSRYGKGATGKMHLLRFKDEFTSTSKAKPAGAARLELFIELLAEDERIPNHPGELSGGRPWYLRSFTRSPIEVEFPMPDRPMRVVYWARWAGAKGDVGPFSKTCIAEVEGWPTSRATLPDQTEVRRRQQTIVITSARLGLPECAESVEQVRGEVGRLLPAADGDYEMSRPMLRAP